MSLAVLLRLHERELASGRVVGRAEAVETGTQTTIRSLDELAGFLRRISGSAEHGGPSDEAKADEDPGAARGRERSGKPDAFRREVES